MEIVLLCLSWPWESFLNLILAVSYQNIGLAYSPAAQIEKLFDSCRVSVTEGLEK